MMKMENWIQIVMKGNLMSRGRPKAKPSEQELEFQNAYSKWVASGDKSSYDVMWIRIRECCNALASKLLKGLYTSTFDDRVMDATIKCMENVIKGEHPRKLSSYCYWPVVGAVWGPKAKKEDKEECYDNYLNNISYEKVYIANNMEEVRLPNEGILYDVE